MALFTDGSIATIIDLRGYESSILDVAHGEDIDLTIKLRLAQEEVGVELEEVLRQMHRSGGAWVELGNVVVTSPLRQWQVFRALALVYRDAYNRALNDRYQGKWQEYERLAQWALRMLRWTGIGWVQKPIGKAAAPEMDIVPSTAPAARYYVQVAWCDPSGQEGAPSEVGVLDVPDGGAPAIRVTSAEAGGTGWNVYAGTTDTDVMLQNDTPLAAGQQWVMPPMGLRQGRRAGVGQSARNFLTSKRILQRG